MDFGFCVRWNDGFCVRWNDNGGNPDEFPSGWSVALPHQCEEWQIAGSVDEPWVPHGRAVADLEAFIAEAQRALEALKAGQDFGPPT